MGCDAYADVQSAKEKKKLCLTLSRLWTTYVVQRTEIFQKFAVHTVLELCTHCRYQHMRIELLFHMVFSTSCFEVRFCAVLSKEK